MKPFVEYVVEVQDVRAAALVYLADTIREVFAQRPTPNANDPVQVSPLRTDMHPSTKAPLKAPEPAAESTVSPIALAVHPNGPSEEELRAALVKASRACGASKVPLAKMKEVAGVDKVIDCPPEKAQALFDAFDEIAKHPPLKDEIPF